MSEERKGILKGLTRSTVEALAMKMGLKPNERGWVTVDIGAALVGVSPKTAMDFFKAVPEAAKLLESDDLRAWAEIGKKIALANPDEASEFFHFSLETLGELTPTLRSLLISLCTKQIILSPATALASFRNAPRTVLLIGNNEYAAKMYSVAVEVAQRSVKHSTEVLASAPRALQVLKHLEKSGAGSAVSAVLSLVEIFAQRTGATAAELLMVIGEGFGTLTASPADIVSLCKNTAEILERGGATALQYFKASGSVLDIGGSASYEKWHAIVRKVADEGNAAVYDFLKLTPKTLTALTASTRNRAAERINVVLDVVDQLSEINVYVAFECFKSSPKALASSSIEQFRTWAAEGSAAYKNDRRKAQAYYALESKSSREILHGARDGVTLESISHLLRLYIEGLTGREMNIAPLGAIPDESKISDGHTIQLPSVISEFGSMDDDFKLYKALAAHGAGQIEFGTRSIGTSDIRAALTHIESHYLEREKNRKHDEINSPEFVQYSNSEHLNLRSRTRLEPEAYEFVDYTAVIARFPNPSLAARIFTTLENGRIDWKLRSTYRGIRRDLDIVRNRLIERRPPLAELTIEQAVYELLFQIAICGGVVDQKARELFGDSAISFENIIVEYIRRDDATVGDTLMATFKVYETLAGRADKKPIEKNAEDQQEDERDNDQESGENELSSKQQSSGNQQQRSVEFFNQWAEQSEDADPLDSDMLSDAINADLGEQELQEGDIAFFYDEWDRELGDYRSKWCRVIQRENRKGARDFVDQVRARYSGIISSIRYQFQMLKPESMRKIKGELDGEDYDLQAVIDHYVDKRTTGRPSDRLYVRRIRRERDVAVSFLLDMSSSTARTISRHPNQPYTRPGQKIIDIEKQGLVLMGEALEAVGDAYSISGFTSEGRRNVKYFTIKEFNEKYTSDVEKRIGGITYHNNTRLGAAIRHAASRLEKQDARTKLLIVLSDGRPYDHDYGDSRYAREDTKTALRQTKTRGITPFCITIDRESEAELKDLYGEIGYTIIDDVMSLPERLPGIYKRLTT